MIFTRKVSLLAACALLGMFCLASAAFVEDVQNIAPVSAKVTYAAPDDHYIRIGVPRYPS